MADAEKALENEKLKSAVPEERLAEAKQKLREGDASSVEELFSQFLEKKGNRDKAWAEVAFVLGKLAQDRIDYHSAQKYFDHAVRLASGNGLYLNEAGSMAHILGEYDQAIKYHEKALESGLKNFGPDHPTVAQSLNNLALLYYTQGQYAQAEPLYKRSLAVWEKALGPDHPNVVTSLENMAVLYRKTGRVKAGQELEKRVLAIRARQ